MTSTTKHIVIIGGGPGGLTAAMILANRGYKVTMFEQDSSVGGRNKALTLGPYTFDTGPTFLMMDFFLREMFTLAGKRATDYLELIRLEPMYKLSFDNKTLSPTTDHEEMKRRLAVVFPKDAGGLDAFLRNEKVRYDKMFPCLKLDYSSIGSMVRPTLLKALPYLSLTKSLFQNLGSYFDNDRCKLSFTFQAKYLGMSPWDCPALFTLIPFVEHEYGIYHVKGGLSRISDAMAEVAKEHGATINCNQPVKKILVDNNKKATGIELENGEKIGADAVIINTDFGHAMQTFFEPGILQKYTPEKLAKKKLSCSTYMLYFGLDTTYKETHHHIIFAKNYRQNLSDIVSGRALSRDMSMYIRYANGTDSTLAPEGHSALYVLVPVPNLRSAIRWDDELIESYRDNVIDRISERTTMTDLRTHIKEEAIITPQDWESKYKLYKGATFNLAHNLGQMLYFRPHNRFEEVGKCYLVGGGTHPGSGLPTIYESARITSDLITKDIQIWL